MWGLLIKTFPELMALRLRGPKKVTQIRFQILHCESCNWFSKHSRETEGQTVFWSGSLQFYAGFPSSVIPSASKIY